MKSIDHTMCVYRICVILINFLYTVLYLTLLHYNNHYCYSYRYTLYIIDVCILLIVCILLLSYIGLLSFQYIIYIALFITIFCKNPIFISVMINQRDPRCIIAMLVQTIIMYGSSPYISPPYSLKFPNLLWILMI